MSGANNYTNCLDTNHVKILVVGESGVGKTTLVNLIAHNKAVSNPTWTVGCGIEIKLHDYKCGTPEESGWFVELWDIGGSRSHKNSRNVFYQSLSGLILVHDLSNRKSQENLRYWLQEIFETSANTPTSTNQSLNISIGSPKFGYDEEQFVSERNDLPTLVVGTKLDLAPSKESASGVSQIAQECRAEEINLECRNPKYLAAGTTNALKLTKFLDKVIERHLNKQNRVREIGEKKRRKIL